MARLATPVSIPLSKDVLVMLLAGGKGTRLHELTQQRAKPALEFGSNHRIIDFPLSNCVNSGLRRIGVLTQFGSQCLIRHLIQNWSRLNQDFDGFLELLPASQQNANHWYQGTADALFQNLNFIKDTGAKYVLVLAADHIYKMDYRRILAEHVRQKAQMTVSCIEVPIKEAAGQLGVMEVDGQNAITSFLEKPESPPRLADAPDYTLASMGNYVFNTDFLIYQLQQDAQNPNSEHDFGKNIIPSALPDSRICAFRFRDAQGDQIPYWRDVGTLDAYWQANMALINNLDPISISDQDWPLGGSLGSVAPTQFFCHGPGQKTQTTDAIIGPGCHIHSCSIEHAVVSADVHLAPKSRILQSLLLPGVKVGKGARVQQAIIDRDVTIPDGMQIGVSQSDDLKRQFRVSPGGVVLVTQAMLDRLPEARTLNGEKENQDFRLTGSAEGLIGAKPPLLQ